MNSQRDMVLYLGKRAVREKVEIIPKCMNGSIDLSRQEGSLTPETLSAFPECERLKIRMGDLRYPSSTVSIRVQEGNCCIRALYDVQ